MSVGSVENGRDAYMMEYARRGEWGRALAR